jgi:hypothetical protein
MTFKKGHKHAIGSNGQLRRDLTVELISQLNEVAKDPDGVHRPKMHRLVRNLITQATTSADEHNEKGKLVKEGAGNLTAILAVFDRLEGKAPQSITGPNDGPVQLELKTAEEVRLYLLQRGFDIARLPPPNLQIEHK